MLTAFYRVPLWNFNFSLLINIFCDISPPFSFKFFRFPQYFPRKCINKDQLLMLENWDFKRKNLLKSEISFYPYKSKHYQVSGVSKEPAEPSIGVPAKSKGPERLRRPVNYWWRPEVRVWGQQTREDQVGQDNLGYLQKLQPWSLQLQSALTSTLVSATPHTGGNISAIR